jgi:hypothetical protein
LGAETETNIADRRQVSYTVRLQHGFQQMRRNSQALAVLLTLATTALIAEQPELPTPPDGFDWQWCEDVKVGLLKPKGWHFQSEKKNDTRAYFITKEKIDPKTGFETGLSLNVIPGVGKKSGGSTSGYAIQFVRQAIRDRETVLEVFDPDKIGPARTVGCRIKKDGSVIHYFLVADNDRDMLYLFSFESPDKQWEIAWKTGEQMFKQLMIDFPEDESK